VITRYGPIPDLHVPKLRQHNAIRTWHILARYQQAMPQVLDTLCYLYTMGLSLRDLQEGLYVAFGGVLSRSAVNRVTLAAQAPMDAWRQQPITDTPPILIVDGVWVTLYHPTGATFLDRSGQGAARCRVVTSSWRDGAGRMDAMPCCITRLPRPRTPPPAAPSAELDDRHWISWVLMADGTKVADADSNGRARRKLRPHMRGWNATCSPRRPRILDGQS
jgi:hypothetical protein